MNTHDDIADRTPDDLRDMEQLLAALGAADQDAAPPEIAAGVFAASIEVFRAPVPADVRAQADQLETLGRLERAGAPASIERDTYEASRPMIAAAARQAARVHEPGGRRAVAGRIGPARRLGTMLRIAAAVLLVGGTVAVVVSSRHAGPVNNGPDSSVLAASFDRELRAFMDLLDAAPSAEYTDRSDGIEVDPSWTEALLEWESL
ncbi:MAG: hypothetical protein KF699_08085 [Phycisphaeraceae bacterium]|nr:hypothetical protein [Phycisphaeraceae bacterium]